MAGLGFDLAAFGNRGASALHHAAWHGHPEMVSGLTSRKRSGLRRISGGKAIGGPLQARASLAERIGPGLLWDSPGTHQALLGNLIRRHIIDADLEIIEARAVETIDAIDRNRENRDAHAGGRQPTFDITRR